MDIIAAIITDAQPPHLVQQGKGLLHDIAIDSQPAAVFSVASRQGLADALSRQRGAMRIAVIPAVAQDFLGFAQGPSHLAPQARDRLDKREQLGHVVPVGRGKDRRQRRSTGINDQVVLGTLFGPIGGVGTRFFPPCTARTEAESTMTREKSMASLPRSLSSKTQCSFSSTPARRHSSSRFHRVMPEHPISCGKSSQGMPVLRTKRIPLRPRRSLLRGWPPLELGVHFGRIGSTTAHNSSVTSQRAMTLSSATRCPQRIHRLLHGDSLGSFRGSKYIYDAWNRMVKVTDNSDVTIAEYRYDGLNQRIVKLLPNGETNWDRTDFYYNANWQCLEERYGANQQKDILPTNTKIQWLWSVQYIDAPVLRWRDTSDPPDGTLDETLYYCNDANMNVTTLINTDGSVAERYVYDPYGNVKVYSDDWTTEIGWSASKKNNIRFCGYYFDNETGLDNPRSRYYLPPLGCMTTRGSDKYDYPNLNEYVRGNTLNRVDPSGMHEFEITHKNGEVAVKSTDMFIDTMGPIYHTETVKLGTLKPATGEVGYDLVEMTSGVSVGREILELWALQLGYLPRSEQLKKFAEGHDASKPCGSECTEALSDVLKRIAEFYNSKDKEKQEKLCCTVFDYWEGGPNINSSRAWDINQLFALSSTGFRESWRSVRVNGKCYDAGSVNYVMYGLMGKLCKKTYDTVLGRVTTWKQLAYHHPPDRETVAWLKAGYDGWDTTKKVDSITPYSLKVESRNPIGGFTFTWLPYMIGGKSKNE